MVYNHACMQYLNKTGSGIWSMNMGRSKYFLNIKKMFNDSNKKVTDIKN